MALNPLAQELNATIAAQCPTLLEHLSTLGRALYFPKGILTQSAEAKQKAHRYNATIGIATEGGTAMHLPVVHRYFQGLSPDECYPYAPSFGLLALRQAWAAKQRREMPSLDAAISLPVVTCALTHALNVVGELVVDRGDEVLLPDQLWGNYRLTWGTRMGAQISTFPFFNQDLTAFNQAAFAQAVSERVGKKLIVVLNFPNNPSGYSPSRDEAAAISATLIAAAEAGSKVVVICDDAYYGMFYDDTCEIEPIFARLAGAHENLFAIKVDGGTKEAFIWGLRVGFVTFGLRGATPAVYEALEKKTAGAIRGSISNVSMASQSILLKAINDPQFLPQQQAKVAILRSRYEAVRTAVELPAVADCWQAYPFNSGYFMCLKLHRANAEAVRLDLLQRHGVGVISLGETDIRVAFSCLELEHISDCFERIADSVRHCQNAG